MAAPSPTHRRLGSLERADFRIERRDELGERHSHRDAEGTGLNEVQPPFPSLALVDERLCLAQPLGELVLRHARTVPGVAEASEEDLVVT